MRNLPGIEAMLRNREKVMRLFLSTMLVFVLFLAAAQAQECNDASDQATLNQCAAKEFQAADKQLNADFKEIAKRLGDDADTKKLLVAAQRAWVSFRDAECTFQTSAAAQGTIYPMLFAYCKTALTNDRVEQLKTYLACEEGDMSCPVPAAE